MAKTPLMRIFYTEKSGSRLPVTAVPYDISADAVADMLWENGTVPPGEVLLSALCPVWPAVSYWFGKGPVWGLDLTTNGSKE